MKRKHTDSGIHRTTAPGCVVPSEILRSSLAALLLPLSLALAIHGAPAEPVSPVSPASAVPNGGAQPGAGEGGTEWQIATRLTTVVTYDDNIFIRPKNRDDDFALHIAPGIAVGRGNFRSEFAPFAAIPHFLARAGDEELPHRNFVYASYTPDGLLFADHSAQNALNHDVRVAGRRERELWAAQGQFAFRSVKDANIDVGRRLRQNYYTGEASADYALTAKTTGRLALHGEHNDYVGGFESSEGRATGFVAYQVAPKTEFGVGGAFGYLSVARGADQTYQQPLLQLKYYASEKIAFTGQAGEEFRQFDGDLGQRTRFVFAASGNYAPGDGTSLSFASRRETHSSAQYAGENIVATTYQGSLRQRWWQRNYLTLRGGFVHNDYQNNQPSAALVRTDRYYFGRISSSRDVTERGTVELGYEYRANVSSASNLGFDQNVVTLALSLLF